MSVSKQLIDNVNKIKTTLNEISVYNLDVKTAIELYYELAKKVNEVINELSRFEGVVSDEVIKQNEKLIYLLGEGLKVQVGLKIDELIKDGTIQDLINNKIFNDLNTKIDTITQENTNKNNNNENFIGVFFNGNDNYSNDRVKHQISFYNSSDGINFNKITEKTLTGKDPSILYHNGKCYIASTKNTWSEGVYYHFDIYVSENMKDWTLHQIDLGNASEVLNDVWAPDWFVDDDGKIYIIYSHNVSEMIQDLDKRDIYNMRTFIVECTDIDKMVFGTPRKLNLDGDYSRIDGYIFKENNTYYLYTKRDGHQGQTKYGRIELFTSTNLINWTLINNDLFPNYEMEGQSVEKLGENKYIMYIDNIPFYGYDSTVAQARYMHYSLSNDLINWSEPKLINTKHQMRHGNVRKIDNILSNKLNQMFITNNSKGIENNLYNNSFICCELPTNNLESKKYLKLFSVITDDAYKETVVNFRFMDSCFSLFDSTFDLKINKKPTSSETPWTITLTEENRRVNVDLASKMFVLRENNVISVYFDKTLLADHNTLIANISINNFISKFEVLKTFNNIFVNDITVLGEVINCSPLVIKNNGVINTAYLDNSDFECRYIKYGKLCIVNYTFKVKSDFTDLCKLATGLPIPEMGVRFNVPVTPKDEYNSTNGCFRINDNGEIEEFYGGKPKVGTVLKGSFSYIAK